jgi:hypothetical protein
LATLRPEVPDQLTAVVAKMMAKRPAERYPTAAAVAAALAPFAGRARRKRPRRARALFALAGLLVLATVSGVAASLLRIPQGRGDDPASTRAATPAPAKIVELRRFS